MALGALPTKTAVRISDGTGQNAEIPAAFEGAAGVMTPEHIKALKSLLEWREAILSGSDTRGPASADVVTRAELNEALALGAKNGGEQQDRLEPRLAALEDRATRVASALTQLKAGPDISEIKRLVRDAVATETTTRQAQGSASSDVQSQIVTLNAKMNDLAEAVTTLAAAAATNASVGAPNIKPLADAINDLNGRVIEIESVIATLKRLAQYKADAA